MLNTCFQSGACMILVYQQPWTATAAARMLSTATFKLSASKKQRADLWPLTVQALLKQYREASNLKDLERQYMLETRIFDTEEPGFMSVNPHFHGRQGYGSKLTWPEFGRATRLGLYLMDLASLMDGAPSFLDYIRLLEVQSSSSETLHAGEVLHWFNLPWHTEGLTEQEGICDTQLISENLRDQLCSFFVELQCCKLSSMSLAGRLSPENIYLKWIIDPLSSTCSPADPTACLRRGAIVHLAFSSTTRWNT